ncbi:hypothetical protein [Microbacterium sp. ZW T5_56]|uniref:hypothetical protein n=1 Tax=Microbacterium sp. ZW T5_56 TaxID=3378081 RepID=UPI0038552DA2
MFDEIKVDVGAIVDQAVAMEKSAESLQLASTTLLEKLRELQQSTAGGASDAASTMTTDMIGKIEARAGKLTRNAKVTRELAALYDAADREGARAFGD